VNVIVKSLKAQQMSSLSMEESAKIKPFSSLCFTNQNGGDHSAELPALLQGTVSSKP